MKLSLLCLLFSLSAAAAPTRITLLHVNDTHSHLAPWGEKDANLAGVSGGLARAATVIARERALASGASLFVHAGDFLHGDLFFNQYLGIPELQALQHLGLDALVLGNHEFQFGPHFLAAALHATWPAGAGAVPIVGTNLDLTDFPALGAWVAPTFIKEVSGVKVGFFGLTTPYDPLAIPAPVRIGDDLAAASASAAQSLRAAGAQVVVALAHVDYEILQMIGKAVPGIDVIVGGHTHMTLSKPEALARPDGGTTWLVYAGEYFGWVGRLRLLVEGNRVSVESYKLLTVDQDTEPEPSMAALVGMLQMGITATYGDVYGTAVAWAQDHIKETWNPHRADRDTPIGDLWTDAYRAATGTDVAVEAGGFLDEGLPAGALVGADIYRVNSYGIPVVPEDGSPPYVRPFKLVTFRLSGAELIKGLEIGIATPGGLFLQVSGMRFDLDSQRPPFQRVLLETVRIGGQPLDPQRLYSVTANEGVVMFLPQLGIEAVDIEPREVTAAGAAMAALGARGFIEPMTDGRIRDVAFARR